MNNNIWKIAITPFWEDINDDQQSLNKPKLFSYCFYIMCYQVIILISDWDYFQQDPCDLRDKVKPPIMATACAKIWWTLLGVATVQWFSAEIYKPYTKPIVCSFLLFGRQLDASFVELSICERIDYCKTVFDDWFLFKDNAQWQIGTQKPVSVD